MRIPKYQVWHKKEKVMRPVESLILTENGGVWINDYPDTGSCELREWTGLKDKSGKEIYEGDLFGKLGGDQERPDEYEIHGQVKFDSDFAMFVIELTNGGWMELFDYMNQPKSEKEVIGNIYENPELIKND